MGINELINMVKSRVVLSKHLDEISKIVEEEDKKFEKRIAACKANEEFLSRTYTL